MKEILKASSVTTFLIESNDTKDSVILQLTYTALLLLFFLTCLDLETLWS